MVWNVPQGSPQGTRSDETPQVVDTTNVTNTFSVHFSEILMLSESIMDRTPIGTKNRPV